VPGQSISSDHTLNLKQTEYSYPTLSNRMSPKKWLEAERPEMLRGTAGCHEQILAEAPIQIAPELDREIRARFKIYF